MQQKYGLLKRKKTANIKYFLSAQSIKCRIKSRGPEGPTHLVTCKNKTEYLSAIFEYESPQLGASQER